MGDRSREGTEGGAEDLMNVGERGDRRPLTSRVRGREIC